MKSKFLIVIIVTIIILVGGFLILRDNSANANQEHISEVNFQENPNFYQEHPKGDQFSIGITGEEMNLLTLEENALIWRVDIDEFVNEFNNKFKTNAQASDKLGDVLPDYKNSNRDVKIILDNLK